MVLTDKPMSFADKLLKHYQEKRYPTLQETSGIEDWSLNELQIDRATEIVKVFTLWEESTGQCPISPSDRHWFKKLCALAEWIAILEAKIDPEAFSEEEEEDPDGT